MENKEFQKTGLRKKISEWFSIVSGIVSIILGTKEILTDGNFKGISNNLIGYILIIIGVVLLGYFVYSIISRINKMEDSLIRGLEIVKKYNAIASQSEINSLIISFDAEHKMFCHINNIDAEDKNVRKEFVKGKVMSLAHGLRGIDVNTALDTFYK